MSNLPAPPSVWIILGPALLVAVLLVLLSIFARPENRPPEEGWKGIFYSNPDDPALLVLKRFEAVEKQDGIHEFPAQKFWGVGLFLIVRVAVSA